MELKSGLKTSEGLYTGLSMVASFVVSLLVVLRVVEPESQANLVEIVTQGLVAIATLVVAGLALREYISGRLNLKSQLLEQRIVKTETNG